MPAISEKYDLCISLEVAEHVSRTNAGNFINLLCQAADVILFSAAVKQQGGTHHINEQRQSYWIEIFRDNGYEHFDIIRPYIWDDERIEWWYRQNIFLFSRNEKKVSCPESRSEYPTLSYSMNCLKKALINKVRGITPPHGRSDVRREDSGQQ